MVSNKRQNRGRPRSSENALSKWIDAAKLSREAVAKSVEITKASLDRYCRGERIPTLGAALAIEKVTNGAIPARSWVTSPGR